MISSSATEKKKPVIPPIVAAAKKGDTDRIQILLEEADTTDGETIINACDGEGITGLIAAAKLGRTKVVKMLIERKASLGTASFSALSRVGCHYRTGIARSESPIFSFTTLHGKDTLHTCERNITD